MSAKVCVVTTTRAESGLLNNLIQKLSRDPFFNLVLIVSGTHLVKEFGNTSLEIKKFNYNCEIIELPILKIGDKSYQTLSKTIDVFGNHFHKNKYDCVILLGDRFEIMGVAEACLLENIPICHLCGGDITFGAIDDCCRHAITKMSNIHFTGNDDMRKRVIQLGENPETVFNVGEPGVENVLKTQPMTLRELKNSLQFEELEEKNFYIVTYHPETISKVPPIKQIEIVMDVILKHNEYKYIITKANADAGGIEINNYIKKIVEGKGNIYFIDSLGFKRFLSAMKYSRGVIGNSSSGILEAPYFNIPTINIGNRQEGRMQDKSIINAELTRASIEDALLKANSKKFQNLNCQMLYGDGNTSEKICQILKDFIINNKLERKKNFYDL
ncbi:MAG: UDP-N-acetylglucosamine 2-epimerase (hydrolyzing) [Clostridia bacterium]|nr:UDP-N-acetylglucosamine 2-epimerase (hydrolyzing) [Clostridia bacterium]